MSETMNIQETSGGSVTVALPKSLTDHQLKALADLSGGKWTYGISIRGRRALPSLKKAGLVWQHYGDHSADEWCITPSGEEAFKKLGTIRHLR